MATVNYQVSASADDNYEINGSHTYIGTFHVADATNEYFGFAFDITIPDGATINSATTQFHMHSDSTDEPLGTFYCDDDATPLAFTDLGAGNLSNRTPTTATVPWDAADLGIAGGGGWADGPDIASIITELMASYSYASGGRIVLIYQASATATRDCGIDMYDNDPTWGAKLSITYTEAGAGITLTVQDATHAHVADGPALTQKLTLVVQDSTLGHSVENVVVTQKHALAVSDANHAHTAEGPALTQKHTLAVADAAHAQAADNVTLEVSTATNTPLTVQDATHAHTAESPTLAQKYTLTVDDATHAQTADSISLTQGYVLTVDDAVHGHVADAVVLTQAYTLTVADAMHLHYADTVLIGDIVPVELTLRSRSTALALDERDLALSLKPRSTALTLEDDPR